jgi:hypothetical protein
MLRVAAVASAVSSAPSTARVGAGLVAVPGFVARPLAGFALAWGIG